MKAVVLAAWYQTIAFGNLIVIIVAETKSRTLDQVSKPWPLGLTLSIIGRSLNVEAGSIEQNLPCPNFSSSKSSVLIVEKILALE